MSDFVDQGRCKQQAQYKQKSPDVKDSHLTCTNSGFDTSWNLCQNEHNIYLNRTRQRVAEWFQIMVHFLADQQRHLSPLTFTQKTPMSPKKKRGASSKVEAADGTPVVRVHIWLQNGNSAAFGLGRLMLLQAIDETGSLKSAAESLGMSYRAAWGKLKSSEEALGMALVEKNGGNRSGYALTPFGRKMKEQFRKWFAKVEEEALEQAKELFPFSVQGFEEQE